MRESNEKKIPVWDPAVRVFHWGVAGLVLAAFLTGESDDRMALHARLGLVVLGAVLFRVAWGLFGTPPARFRAFVRAPAEVLAYARQMLRGRPPVHTSHNPVGALMVLALLATLLATTVTGLWAYSSDSHAMEEAHEAITTVLLVLIGAHVVGVVVSSLLERQNLVLGMITGRKRPGDAPVRAVSTAGTALGLLAAASLAYAALRAVLYVFPIAEAGAAEPGAPAALLAAYEGEARRADSGFAGGDPARGKALFSTPVTRDGTARSCTGCHTSDPRQPGKTPAGKALLPLAPSANPAAFTDAAKADKWFDRNCKQVFGRTCTPAEKSHLLRYFLQP